MDGHVVSSDVVRQYFPILQYHLLSVCIISNVMHKFLINLSIYFCLTCFGFSFSPSSEAGVQFRQWFKSLGYGVSARSLTLDPGDLNQCQSCSPTSEDGLKGSPKHVRQKK